MADVDTMNIIIADKDVEGKYFENIKMNQMMNDSIIMETREELLKSSDCSNESAIHLYSQDSLDSFDIVGGKKNYQKRLIKMKNEIGENSHILAYSDESIDF